MAKRDGIGAERTGATALSRYRREVRQWRTLTREEERALITKMRRGATEPEREGARDALIQANLQMVMQLARRFLRWNPSLQIPIEDLIEEGNVGLIEAVDRYDESHGVRLATYATYWIRRRIRDAVKRTATAVMLPDHAATLACRIRHEQIEAEKKTGKTPSIEDLSDRIGIPARDAVPLATFTVVSLDRPIGAAHPGEVTDDRPTLLSRLTDDSWLEIENSVVRNERKELLCSAVRRSLGEREGAVYLRRFVDGDSFTKMGHDYGVSRQRLNQVWMRAHKKIFKILPTLTAGNLQQRVA